MEYNFTEIERKWQRYWDEHKTFSVHADPSKPKYYVLDMFPYPSGAGLHVGHPLGYIASDIFARYKKLQGYNVLHPIGYDAFGLPAEQYAIQTGQHPRITTERNIEKYRGQLKSIGFSFDWDREVKTCDPDYYKWTQWAFIKMFKHWYNKAVDKAEPIESLISEFEKNGNQKVRAAHSCRSSFSAAEWKAMSEKEQQSILLDYRVAYLADTMVNWCPALGTVLANDEVSEGYSIRGGYPVEQKKMKQWSLRLTAYAQRLLEGLDTIDWPEDARSVQKEWIGRSEGADMFFRVKNSDKKIQVFTTRPDTIYGSTYMVLAPEHEWVEEITTEEYREAINAYIEETKRRTERERMAETKKVSGQFTGAYAVHPFTGADLPIFISDYVLAGYGTGAIMAVPAHDSRDYLFAKHFKLPIIEVVTGGNIEEGSYDAREGTLINSPLIDGLEVQDAIPKITDEMEKEGIGYRKINYKIRDAIFSRQRYWGEPFPIYYKDGLPYTLPEEELPLTLPEVDVYLPTEEGDPPLGRARDWKSKEGYPLELSTMPGFAGSSAYFNRYMDPRNDRALVSEEANRYWRDVDLYLGGREHLTGHLIYSRFWNHFLYDLGVVCEKEPFKKMINQGMIQGRSNFVYKIKGKNTFVSCNLREQYDTYPQHVDVNLVENDILDIEAFKSWNPEYRDAEFILEEDGKYHCGWAVEKMSKSMFNVVNPDDVIDRYGADTLRMYEMFLGPIKDSKPWDTSGIDGVHKFLRKFCRLFEDKEGNFRLSEEKPGNDELKVLHKTIKKVSEDIERLSFNTAVSAFMICANELTDLKCNKKEILEPLVVVLSPFAPHICEELWEKLGHKESVSTARFPGFDEKYLEEDRIEYPVSFNGKLRFKIQMPAGAGKDEIEKAALRDERAEKWLGGKIPRKVIVVPGKIVNIVV